MSTEVTKAEAVHPGVFVREELRKSGMTHLEFARRTRWSLTFIERLLACDDAITIFAPDAKQLATAFGGSESIWTALQKKWDEEKPRPFVFDFDSMTERQRDVLGQIAINNDIGHNNRTLVSLERRGLIERMLRPLDALSQVTVARWNMPIYVHVAWCEWCSKQPGLPA